MLGLLKPACARTLAALASLTLVGQPAAICADTVIMANGDRFSGEVVRQDRGRLKLKTAYAGTLDIDWAQVRELRLDHPAEVLLDDERVLRVHAVSRDDAVPRPQPAAPSKPMTIDADRVEIIAPEPWELGRGYKLGGRLELAAKMERGNTHKNEADVDYLFDYRYRRHRFESTGELEFDTNSGDKTKDKWGVNNNYRYLFGAPWYVSLWLYFQHDRFEDRRLSRLLGPGLGYSLDESVGRNIRGEIGFLHIHDDYYEAEDESYWGPGWLINYDQLVWRDRFQPYHRQYGFVATGGVSRWGWRSWTGIRVPLAKGFVGSVEYQVEYNSAPVVDTKTTDTTLRLKLGYQW